MQNNIQYDKLKIDKAADDPLHIQLGRELRHQIRRLNPSGKIALLSERNLSELLNLNRSTTHRAYADLIKERLVIPQANKTLLIAPDARRKLQGGFPTIGLVIPMRFSDFIEHQKQSPLRYLKGIIDHTTELNISTIMLNLPAYDAPEDQIMNFIEDVCGNLCGLIHFGSRLQWPDKPFEMLEAYSGIPQIFVSGTSTLPHIGSVVSDVGSGAQSLCEQLVDLRHRNIGVISSLSAAKQDLAPAEFQYSFNTRVETMLKYFQKYHFHCPEEWQFYQCGNASAVKQRIAELWTQSERPTVFWCANDEIASQALECCRDLGIKVPEELSIVGFDGADMALDNKLTTIRQPFYAIGSRAVDLLMEHFNSGVTSQNRIVKLPTTLVMKETLGVSAKYS